MRVVSMDVALYVLKTPEKSLLSVELKKTVRTWTLAFRNSRIYPPLFYQ